MRKLCTYIRKLIELVSFCILCTYQHIHNLYSPLASVCNTLCSSSTTFFHEVAPLHQVEVVQTHLNHDGKNIICSSSFIAWKISISQHCMNMCTSGICRLNHLPTTRRRLVHMPVSTYLLYREYKSIFFVSSR